MNLIESDLGRLGSVCRVSVESTVTSVLYVSVSSIASLRGAGSVGNIYVPFFLIVDGNLSISCGISALTSLSTRMNSPARDRSWFSPVKKVTAFPVFPARPVRPHR